MTAALSFLILARRCEIAELEQLALTGRLVGVTCGLIHALQRERGLGSLYLGAGGMSCAPERAAQLEASDRLGADLHRWFDDLDADPGLLGARARLFNRIAFALQGLEELPVIRARVAQRRCSGLEAAAAYTRLNAALLAVVFEAADTAPDPEVSRLLVALFHFIQAKEYAGQERAIGAALFTGSDIDDAPRHQLKRLIEEQERCLAVFETFAPISLLDRVRATHATDAEAPLERMRRKLISADRGTPPDGDLGAAWFAACSHRLDGMRVVEDGLQRELEEGCQRRIVAARDDLERFQVLDTDEGEVQAAGGAAPFYDDPAPLPEAVGHPGAGAHCGTLQPLGPRLGRSVLDLVQEQSQRLLTMRAELEGIRASLDERKVIERAKGLLMALRRLNEEQAHRTLQQMAMNQNRRLVDIAHAVLTLSDMLGGSTATVASAPS